MARSQSVETQNVGINKKICTACKKTKQLSMFYKKCDTPDGLSASCAECQLKYKAKQGKGGIVENGKITGEATLFGVSERWSDYGTEQFIVKTRVKDDRQGRGWAAYHAKKKRTKEGR